MTPLYDLARFGPLTTARFRDRPNRFIAIIDVEGTEYRCHVADTGRMRELLTPDRLLLVAKNRPGMKTAYKLVAARMEEGWVLLNTQAHPAITKKAIEAGVLGFTPEKVKGEVTYGESRLDFLVDDHFFIELKTSNLLLEGECRFPDAPTIRGVKHLRSLMKAKEEGYRTAVLIMGTRNGKAFRPNAPKDPLFDETFKEALKAGVEYHGFRVRVDDETLQVVLDGELPLGDGL